MHHSFNILQVSKLCDLRDVLNLLLQTFFGFQLLLVKSVQPQISSSLREDYYDYEYEERDQDRTASLRENPLFSRLNRQSSSLRSPLRTLSRQAEFLDDTLLGTLDDPLTERQSLIDELLSAGKRHVIIEVRYLKCSRQTKTH